MAYGDYPYGETEYGGLEGAGAPNPNADIDLSSLGTQGRLSFIISIVEPNVQGAIVDLDDLGDQGRLVLWLNRNSDGSIYNPVADAGELWKRVPRHSPVGFLP